MQTIVWEVECLSCVKVRRHCKKCGGKTEYVSSGLFRVNANKKKLDVWLVYRCECCGASWNLPVHERVKPDGLPQGELEGFLQNDPLLAERYAMDAPLLAKRGCEVEPPELAISRVDLPRGRPVRLVIQSAMPLEVRITRVLRQKLGLSARALNALLADGSIRPYGGQNTHATPLAKQKLGCGAELRVHLKGGANMLTIRFAF